MSVGESQGSRLYSSKKLTISSKLLSKTERFAFGFCGFAVLSKPNGSFSERKLKKSVSLLLILF